jgi:hypothetical protein
MWRRGQFVDNRDFLSSRSCRSVFAITLGIAECHSEHGCEWRHFDFELVFEQRVFLHSFGRVEWRGGYERHPENYRAECGAAVHAYLYGRRRYRCSICHRRSRDVGSDGAEGLDKRKPEQHREWRHVVANLVIEQCDVVHRFRRMVGD